MGFEVNTFGGRDDDEKSTEPKRLIVIATEGCKTEIGYFDSIKLKLREYVSAIVEVEVIDRESHSQTDRKRQINEIRPACESLGINIALSNPTFELFVSLN